MHFIIIYHFLVLWKNLVCPSQDLCFELYSDFLMSRNLVGVFSEIFLQYHQSIKMARRFVRLCTLRNQNAAHFVHQNQMETIILTLGIYIGRMLLRS